MTTETSAPAFEVKVGGSALTAEQMEHLALIRVEESIALPSTFTLRFLAPDFAFFDGTLVQVGKDVEIALGWGTTKITVVRGEVTAITAEANPSTGVEILVTGLDKMHRIMRGTKTRTFQNQSDTDVATKIAQENGLTAEVGSGAPTHDFLIQANESDFIFLRKRARRIGFDFWVTDSNLYFKPLPSASPIEATWGTNLFRFKARMSGVSQVNEVEVRGWNDATQQVITGSSTSTATNPTDASFYTGFLTEANTKFTSKKRVTSHFPVKDQAEATKLAGSMRQRLNSSGLMVRGEMDGNANVGAGSKIKVGGVGTKLSGNYIVTSAEHILGARQPYVTRFVCSGPEPTQFADLLASTVDASGQGAGGAGGLTTGIVTNVNDPDGAGRVKVKLSSVDSTNSETGWARVATPGAGDKRGIQMLPAVNDEVLVGFDQGDPSRPFVLGGLWSKKWKPPEGSFHNNGKVEKQFWRSGKGHEFKIDDAGGEVAITLKDIKSTLSIKKAETTLKGEQKLKIEGQDIEIVATGKLTLKGRQIEVNGSQDVTIKGGMIKLN